MVDSHCHLDDPRFAQDLPEVLNRAQKAGITAMVCAGYSPQRWPRQLELARRYPQVYPALGLHPWAVGPEWERDLAGLDLSQAVALGEIGLDRLRPWEHQEAALRAQLELAGGLPVILHVVRAHQDILRHLPARLRGVMHSYSGSPEQLPPFLERGLSISFSARFKPASARAVPRERLLVETDAPDQPIEKGSRNEPSRLPEIVERIAAARGESAKELANYTAENARRLFGL